MAPEAVAARRTDIKAALQLRDVLGTGNRKLAARLNKAVEFLCEAGVARGMAWRSTPGDLQQTLAPLLRKRGISMEWRFVKDLEATGKFNALKSNEFLPMVVGDYVGRLGHVLAHLDEGSDAYLLAGRR